MNLRVIVTGVTGMVGEGVLHECLIHPDVGEALTLGRRPSGMSHPKLREIVHDNFFDLGGHSLLGAGAHLRKSAGISSRPGRKLIDVGF